jgi:hypothetical protein
MTSHMKVVTALTGIAIALLIAIMLLVAKINTVHNSKPITNPRIKVRAVKFIDTKEITDISMHILHVIGDTIIIVRREQEPKSGIWETKTHQAIVIE